MTQDPSRELESLRALLSRYADAYYAVDESRAPIEHYWQVRRDLLRAIKQQEDA